jgi:hypothetical protein
METNNTLIGIELVKELNSKRTQGEWIAIFDNDLPIKSFLGSKFDSDLINKAIAEGLTNENKNHKTDLQYTALAVNNFASVADALAIMTSLCKIKYGNLDKDVYNEILKAEQALNNIKL